MEGNDKILKKPSLYRFKRLLSTVLIVSLLFSGTEITTIAAENQDYFVQMRKNKDYIPSKETMKHVDEVCSPMFHKLTTGNPPSFLFSDIFLW